MSFRLILILTMVCLFGTACSTLDEMQSSQQADDLHLTLMRFEKTIRWGDFALANLMRDPDVRGPLPPNNGYDRVRVTAYHTLSGPLPDESGAMGVSVRIGYVHRDTQIERTMDYRQVWRRQADGRGWWLVSELPVFQ